MLISTTEKSQLFLTMQAFNTTCEDDTQITGTKKKKKKSLMSVFTQCRFHGNKTSPHELFSVNCFTRLNQTRNRIDFAEQSSVFDSPGRGYRRNQAKVKPSCIYENLDVYDNNENIMNY